MDLLVAIGSTSALLYSLTMAVNFSLAVLVVSCPCAFGIAVPLAIVVGVLRSQKAMWIFLA